MRRKSIVLISLVLVGVAAGSAFLGVPFGQGCPLRYSECRGDEPTSERPWEIPTDPLEARAFGYLDIISWLESKISGVPVQDVIRRKYEERMNPKV